MKKIIIGIHGLGNKPKEQLLKKWWKESILEGLSSINKNVEVPFELVYWADIIYEKPLDEKIIDSDNMYYLDEPYIADNGYKRETKRSLRAKIFDLIEKIADKVFLNRNMTTNFEELTEKLIHHYFKDLDTYYCNGKNDSVENCRIKKKIQDRLYKKLSEYADYEIFLIAHSMGSIVAFDVLWENKNKIKIHTFVTIGSPLGIPVIVSKMFNEQKGKNSRIKKPHVPESIKNRWVNLADTEDQVALDPTLFDDYGPNSSGLRAKDKMVNNSYIMNNVSNPHKSYGYLRTQEMAEEIFSFLYLQNKKNIFKSFKDKIVASGSVLLKRRSSSNEKK